MISFNSYPKIFNMGHPATKPLVGRLCRVEEKVDGSQFSFGLIDGKLRCKSRRVEMNPEAPSDLFAFACATVLEIKDELQPGWTYRGEAFKSPRHNTLTYGRVPNRNIAIFDIARGENDYLGRELLDLECERLGLEAVPVLGTFPIDDINDITALLETDSALGDVKVEGVVLKPIEPVYGEDAKPVFAKVVSEEFRELHAGNPEYKQVKKLDMIQQIAASVSTIPRWRKTIQRLRDEGKLEGSPRDIAALVPELQQDILDECEDYIKQALFNGLRKKILGAAVRGFPEFYRAELLKEVFCE